MTTTTVFVDLMMMGVLGAALFYAAITKLRTRMAFAELPTGFEQPGTAEELSEFINRGGHRWIFKHSVTCPVSSHAFNEFRRFMQAHDGEQAALIVVQTARPLSNQIAADFGIRHESPQVFLLVDGKVRWHASHGGINVESLGAALDAESLGI